MVKFTHYLVTRFNVRISGNGPEFIRPDARGADWEEKRMPLFSQFCASSVNGQSRKDFIWLIYTDILTPDLILQKIKNAISDQITYQLIPVENFDALLADLRSRCASVQTPYVITTRLDNDDGVSKDFIQTVQQNFEPVDKLVINLLGGVNYNLRENILTYHRHSLRNAFCSISERSTERDVITIMGFNHLHPPPESTTKDLPIPFAFWMNLHDRNAAMRGNRGIPMINKDFIRHYTIDPRLLDISLPNTIVYTIRWFPNAFKRKMAFKLKALLKKPEQVSSLKNNNH